MENDIQIFKNKKLNLQMRTIQNEDGSISVNAEDTAKGFGWIQNKNGKEYVRWETINAFLNEFDFSQEVGKDDYIPESIFYMLGMKANNKVAQDFQKWLAVDVIPSIRKTGQYQVTNMSKELQSIFMLDNRTVKIEADVKDLKDNMPLFNVECKELQAAVRKLGIKNLHGKNSLAYNDKSLRSRVYQDIQFDITRYEAIKRSQLEIAYEILENYELPYVLKNEIEIINNQIALEEVACTKE